MGATLTDLVRQIGERVLGGDELAQFQADIIALEAPDHPAQTGAAVIQTYQPAQTGAAVTQTSGVSVPAPDGPAAGGPGDSPGAPDEQPGQPV